MWLVNYVKYAELNWLEFIRQHFLFVRGLCCESRAPIVRFLFAELCLFNCLSEKNFASA